jgi:hypothetical protein
MGTRTKNTVKVVFLWKWTEAQEIPDLTFLWEPTVSDGSGGI